MIAPARRAAYDALSRMTRGRDVLGDALATARESLADSRDRALVTSLVTGTLRWRNRLDFLLAQAAARPVDRLDPEVLDLLRLALFQLLYLERVPASAVVDDAVSLTRASGKSSAGGLVNAVLRRLARTRHQLSVPALPAIIANDLDRDAWLTALSITGSHPRWLLERWLTRYGPEATMAWVAFNNEEAPLTLRANTLVTSRDALSSALAESGISTVPLQFAPEGLRVSSGNAFANDLASAGQFVIQDEAAQVVCLLAGRRPRRLTLDTCASPGGKTLVLAAGPSRSGLLVASDRRRRRVALLRQRLRMTHASTVHVVALDLLRGAPFASVFDLVLLDAPCTGLGTLRRDVDIRWRRTPEDIAAAAGRQSRMLDEAARLVAPGGRLVYATCSSEPEENVEAVEGLLERRSDFRRTPRADLVDDGVPDALLNAAGDMETRPDLHALEAFYAAALDRVAGDPADGPRQAL